MSQRCSLCSVNYPNSRDECIRGGATLKSCDDPVTEDWANVDATAAGTETMKVEMWRLRVLLDAGYPIEHAEKLAAASDVDLHTATNIVLEHGCTPELAAAILL